MAYTEVTLKSKEIQVSAIQRTLVMDQHIDTFAFKIPKMWGRVDLSDAVFYMKYELPSGDKFRDLLETDPGSASDPTMLAFWTPDNTNATSENGNVKIQLDAAILIDGVTYHWESKIASINVASNIVTEEEGMTATNLFVEMQAYFLNMKDLSVAAQLAAEYAQEAAESASTTAYAAQVATQEQAGLAHHFAIIANQKAEAAEAARIAAVEAYNNALASMNSAWSLVGSLESLEAAVLSASGDASDAETARIAAEGARDTAVTAAGTAGTAKDDTIIAKDAVLALYGDAAAMNAAKVAAELAETNAQTAETNAIAANASAQSAKTLAVSARNDAVGAKEVAVAAQGIAVTSKETAILAVVASEAARDAILNDTGYQMVLSEIALAGNITIVAGSIDNVDAVGGNILAVKAVDDNKTNINAVNANKANINKVAEIHANVNTVAAANENIATVATDIDAVNHASENMDAIIAAPSQAALAGDSKVEAGLSEANALAYAQLAQSAAANGWMIIDGQKYVVSRKSKNGHIIKTVSLYVEAI